MSTHAAVVTVAPRAPLQVVQVPTVPPEADEVLLHVEWTGSTPLDLHYADHGLGQQHPAVLGSGYAGTVVKLGPDVKYLQKGDKVFGFGMGAQKQKAHQELATVPEYQLGKIPEGTTPQAAVTLPSNFVTVLNTLVRDFGWDVPWPKPAGWTPAQADAPVFVWGASSSVGQFALQILRFYGYRRVLAAASAKQHALLRELGATHVFDYRDARAVDEIKAAAAEMRATAGGPSVPFVIDCIGSLEGSMRPIAAFAEPGALVAVMLPVIVTHASADVAPEYSFDVAGALAWPAGVRAVGVRTHFYLESAFLKDKAQRVIMPEMLARGIVRPNRQTVVEGATLLERATRAMDTLRSGAYSGEKLVWRINEGPAQL